MRTRKWTSVWTLLLVTAATAVVAAAGGEGEHHESIWPLVGKIVNFAILAGTIFYFGRKPIAGYLAGKDGEKLAVVPLLKETLGPRMAYRITFGVRQGEDDWKRELNALIAKLQGRFDAVLLDYGVPLLDEQDHLITAPRK